MKIIVLTDKEITSCFVWWFRLKHHVILLQVAWQPYMLSLYLQMEGTGSEVGMFAYGCSKSVKSKNITLDLLIRDGVLEPAHNCLSVKYLVSFLRWYWHLHYLIYSLVVYPDDCDANKCLNPGNVCSTVSGVLSLTVTLHHIVGKSDAQGSKAPISPITQNIFGVGLQNFCFSI